MMKEIDSAVLAADLPELGLAAGDVGTVAMVHDAGRGYEVEFVRELGLGYARQRRNRCKGDLP